MRKTCGRGGGGEALDAQRVPSRDVELPSRKRYIKMSHIARLLRSFFFVLLRVVLDSRTLFHANPSLLITLMQAVIKARFFGKPHITN